CWPAVVVCGGVFALVQFAWSNLVGPELVDIVGGLGSLIALAAFCRVWKPRETFEFAGAPAPIVPAAIPRPALIKAWLPWVILSVVVIIWGLAPVKAFMNGGPAG